MARASTSRAVGSIRFSLIWTTKYCTICAQTQPPEQQQSTSRGPPRVSIPCHFCIARRAVPPRPIPWETRAPARLTPAIRFKPVAVAQAGRTDYAINGGSTLTHSSLDSFSELPGPPQYHVGHRRKFSWPVLVTANSATEFNGIAAVHSQVTEAMITNTKNTTYLVGEKFLSPVNYLDARGIDNTSGLDPGDLFSAMSGDDVGLIRWGNENLPPLSRTLTRQAISPQIRHYASEARTPPDGTRPFATGTCRSLAGASTGSCITSWPRATVSNATASSRSVPRRFRGHSYSSMS